MNKKFIGLFLATTIITTHAFPALSNQSCTQENDWALAPIHKAARDGQIETIRELIGKNHDVNDVDYDAGWTPLHVAAFHGNAQCFSVLIDHHSDTTLQISSGPYTGLTAEALAREKGHQEVLDFFVLEVPAPHFADIEGTQEPAGKLAAIQDWWAEWWRS
ncbi:ankyrin repeat domain-containing protein [bacterium]|nr:MAG: ankyrin repeat domain-containing protein [bacterium]